jgi:hypothetical protein
MRRCSDRRSRFQPKSLYFSAKSRALDSGRSGLVRQAVIRFTDTIEVGGCPLPSVSIRVSWEAMSAVPESVQQWLDFLTVD